MNQQGRHPLYVSCLHCGGKFNRTDHDYGKFKGVLIALSLCFLVLLIIFLIILDCYRSMFGLLIMIFILGVLRKALSIWKCPHCGYYLWRRR